MRRNYKRMYELIRPLFQEGELTTRRDLYERLKRAALLEKFEQIYQQDCHCTGTWSFWDYSDRFQRFAANLCSIHYWICLNKHGLYYVARY